MSTLHLLKFIAIDGFDLVNDILDNERIALLEEGNDVQGISEGGSYAKVVDGF